MEEYTKGGWYVEEDDMEEISILVIAEGADFPDTIATVRLIGNYDGTEMEANACLIAQSPKMYEAIKSAITEIEDGSANHAHLILTESIRELEDK